MIIGEWFEAGAVGFLFSFALLLESWSVGRARNAIRSLVDLSPTKARYRAGCCGKDGHCSESEGESEGEIVEASNAAAKDLTPRDSQLGWIKELHQSLTIPFSQML